MQHKKYMKCFMVMIATVLAISVSVFAYALKISPPSFINSPHTLKATGTIEVGFSPAGGITQMIVDELNSSKKSIEVQAYSFTSAPIAKALADAHKRGVYVRVILDKSQSNGRYSSATYLTNAGIPTHIDRAFAIAHSKIMIVDQKDIITGSFNFTKAAEQSNAENCLILRGNKQLVDLYEQNWNWRWNETASYGLSKK
jgi:Phosphatidylserine/phosphatidylglycerophosphate/cardiolipin synthases and related enzymes